MTGIVVSVLVTVLLASSGSAIPTEDIEGYFKDLRKDVMQRFDGLEKSNEALLKELHQFEDAVGPEAKAKANRNQGRVGCEDLSHKCSKYAKRGYCKKKGDQMLKKCPKSCNACVNVTTLLPAQETTKSSTDAGCVDHSHGCQRYAKKGYCEKNDHVVKKCPKSCNACMDVTTQLPTQEKTNSSTGVGCEDHSHKCSKYAKRGYCKKKADQMLKKCPKSCNACMNVTTLLPAQETTKSSTDAGCVDHLHGCPTYAKKGFCEKFHKMVKKCMKSCNACMNVTTQLPAQETTNSSTGAGCEDRSRMCSKYAKRGYCNDKGGQLLKLCPKSCNACMNVTTQLTAQGTTNSSTAKDLRHRTRQPSIAIDPVPKRPQPRKSKDRRHRTNEAFLSVDPASDSDTERTRAKLTKDLRHRTSQRSIAIDPVPNRPQPRKSKDRRHRINEAFLPIDPASDSDTERTRAKLTKDLRHRTRHPSIAIDPVPNRPQPRKSKDLRHRTRHPSIAIDPVPNRPQPRKSKDLRHRTRHPSIAIDPVPKRPQPKKTKDLRHRTRHPSIAIDPVPNRPQPRKSKDRRHRTAEAFLSIDPPSDSDTEHQQPRLTKPHNTRKAADQVPKRPQRRNGNDVAADSPHLAVDPVPLGVRHHSREGILDHRVHVSKGKTEADWEQHRLVNF